MSNARLYLLGTINLLYASWQGLTPYLCFYSFNLVAVAL